MHDAGTDGDWSGSSQESTDSWLFGFLQEDLTGLF